MVGCPPAARASTRPASTPPVSTITAGIGSGDPRFDPAAVRAQAYLELHHPPETEWQPELMRC
jgi:hypothetical protein